MSWTNFKDKLPPENTPVLVVMEQPLYQAIYSAKLLDGVMYEQVAAEELNEISGYRTINFSIECYRAWHLLPEMPSV